MKDPIEDALERLEPAELPPALMARLTAARPHPRETRPSLWRRWLLPLAAGTCAAVGALIWLQREVPPQPAQMVQVAPALPPIEQNDFLVGTREMGIVVGPNQRPYRVMEIEWLEEDIIRTQATGQTLRLETKRREVIPVALEIF